MTEPLRCPEIGIHLNIWYDTKRWRLHLFLHRVDNSFLCGWPCLLTNITEKLKTVRQKLPWLSALFFLNFLCVHHSLLLQLQSQKTGCASCLRLFLPFLLSLLSFFCLCSVFCSVTPSSPLVFRLSFSVTVSTLHLTCSSLPFIGHIIIDPLPITKLSSAFHPHFLCHWMMSLCIQDRNLPC